MAGAATADAAEVSGAPEPERESARDHTGPATTDFGTVDRQPPPASWLSFHGAVRNLVYFWRTSLPFRTITLSVALVTATVLAIGLIMSNAIASDLYQTRLAQILAESDRASKQAQATFSSGVETDVVALHTLREQALSAANTAAPNAYGFAFYRGEQSDGPAALQNLVSERVDPVIISADLRQQVQQGAGRQLYQSVTLLDAKGERQPGIIVGRLVDVPTAGQYELYFVYTLEESQRTLDFVQRTLAVSMFVLVLLIAVITGFVMRSVVQPIRLTAQTSRKLASGHLEERIPESGEDDIATLARSFNEMADSLQQQFSRLEHVSQVQQRFVSDVSHELRTPLTTIRLAGQMLFDKRDEFDPVTSRSVELLHDQIERFELLLADLLEISRFDAGAVELLRESNSLATLADEVIGAMTQVALDHGSELVLLAPGGHGDSEFDRRRVSRVVRNLLGNAIEHGEGKPIIVRVDSNSTAVALSVRDYGVGMTPEQVTRAFDRFWRADPSRKRTMGGSGLGLAISLEDAALHDGLLEVWSALGQGSNFRLTLPRHVGDQIVVSPLPLEPDDAGAAEPTLAVQEPGVFADEDVDTQPIILPAPASSAEASPATAAIELPTVSAAAPAHPSETETPWMQSVEVVVIQSPEGEAQTPTLEGLPEAAETGGDTGPDSSDAATEEERR